MKKTIEEYENFFSEANKVMSKESVARAEEKADRLILNLKLGELRKEMGIKQVDIEGFRQSSISKIEKREDLRISTLISYCKALGVGVEIRTVPDSRIPRKKPKVLLRAV